MKWRQENCIVLNWEICLIHFLPCVSVEGSTCMYIYFFQKLLLWRQLKFIYVKFTILTFISFQFFFSYLTKRMVSYRTLIIAVVCSRSLSSLFCSFVEQIFVLRPLVNSTIQSGFIHLEKKCTDSVLYWG